MCVAACGSAYLSHHMRGPLCACRQLGSVPMVFSPRAVPCCTYLGYTHWMLFCLVFCLRRGSLQTVKQGHKSRRSKLSGLNIAKLTVPAPQTLFGAVPASNMNQIRCRTSSEIRNNKDHINKAQSLSSFDAAPWFVGQDTPSVQGARASFWEHAADPDPTKGSRHER